MREWAAELGLAGESSLAKMLVALEAQHYIVKQGGGAERRQRFYTLTPKGEVALPGGLLSRRLPVLGAIPAGLLALAVQECAEFVDVGDSLRAQPGDFFLRVAGESMLGAGILPRDLVLLRPGIQVNDGDIAAVQLQGDDGVYAATLKHLHFQARRQTVRLRAANPAYEDMIVPAQDVTIAGVYRGLIRRPS